VPTTTLNQVCSCNSVVGTKSLKPLKENSNSTNRNACSTVREGPQLPCRLTGAFNFSKTTRTILHKNIKFKNIKMQTVSLIVPAKPRAKAYTSMTIAGAPQPKAISHLTNFFSEIKAATRTTKDKEKKMCHKSLRQHSTTRINKRVGQVVANKQVIGFGILIKKSAEHKRHASSFLRYAFYATEAYGRLSLLQTHDELTGLWHSLNEVRLSKGKLAGSINQVTSATVRAKDGSLFLLNSIQTRLDARMNISSCSNSKSRSKII
uniref:Uncharacterized protein n=1 Tax=Glossina palpalis gambiensis TaxID=67801 RepID=A0A1B0C464_9MUSC